MEKYYETIKNIIETKRKEYQTIAIDIHFNPETSNHEFHACEILSEKLIAEGFDVKVDVAGHRTGFDARYKSNKPGIVVAFLAEYDALPQIGHACGHNLYGATSLLAAVGLKEVIDEIGGEIRVYGTPGEEGGENGSAKASFVREGFFKDVDIALGLHSSYQHQLSGSLLANDPVDIEFFGKPSHAAGSPEKGINALDAIIQVFNSINALREHLTDDVRIHGIITNGGAAPNIVPEYASARFYLRANKRSTVSEVYQKFENIVKGAALATGTTYKFGLFQNSVDNMILTPLFDEVYYKHLKNFGYDITEQNKGLGSSDVGNVSQVIPTIQPYISISDTPIVAHSEEFADAAKSKRGLDSITLGAKLLALTALDIMQDSDLLSKIKKQHQENLANEG